MSTNNNHIDKELNDLLHNQEVMPSDALWAKIEADLDNDKPKVLWWKPSMTLVMGVMFGLFVGAGFGFYAVNSGLAKKQNIISNLSIISNDKTIKNGLPESDKNKSNFHLSTNQDGAVLNDIKLLAENNKALNTNKKQHKLAVIINNGVDNESAIKENVEYKLVSKESVALKSDIIKQHYDNLLTDEMMMNSSFMLKINKNRATENLQNQPNINVELLRNPVFLLATNIKKDTIVKREIVKKDTAIANPKTQNKTKKSWNLKPDGITFQSNFFVPNYDNLSQTIIKNESNLKVSANIRTKTIAASMMFSKSLSDNFDLHLGLSYQQNNFQLSKYSSNKPDLGKIVMYDTLLKTWVNPNTTNNLTYYVGYDSTGKQIYNSNDILPSGFSPTEPKEIAAQIGYVGIPVELMFKKAIWTDYQIQVLVGAQYQFLLYSSTDNELPITASKNSFNYYSSIGLGYNATDKLTLSALVNITKTKVGQFQLGGVQTKSQLVFGPELRCTWLLF